jgi:hypothetical protein
VQQQKNESSRNLRYISIIKYNNYNVSAICIVSVTENPDTVTENVNTMLMI